MDNKAIGSIWHKWDLHFHTPSSYDYSDKSVNNEDIIEHLIAAEIYVVAITDHHLIDTDRILKLRKLSNGKLTILPGIEFRSELGDKPIHYIGIFSELTNLEHLWITIRGALGLTSEDIRNKGGDEKIYIPIKDAHAVFSRLGGLITIHAGAKSNSIECIENKEQFQQRIKYDISKQFVDFLEIGQIKDIERYHNIVFPVTGLEYPIIIGSDNHNINNYTIPLPSWFKANPTFIGLREVINEPLDRVFIGDKPNILDYVKNNQTHYIKSLSFTKTSESRLNEKWFSNINLEFNNGMIAIIGNKGNGKSALADVLGLLGNCPHEESFPFLQKEQFRNPKENKAKSFNALLTWESGDTIRKNLDDKYDPSSIETIRYIPQFHLETICDELKGGKEGRFNEELRQVIFSRVPSEERLSMSTLDELVEFRTSEFKEKISLISNELKKTIQEVVKLEEMSTEAYINKLKSELEAIKKELESHRSIKPSEIQKPETDPKIKKEMDEINLSIYKFSGVTKILDKEIGETEEVLKSVVYKLRLIEKIHEKVTNFQTTYQLLISSVESDFKELGLPLDGLINLNIDLKIVKQLEDSLQVKKKNLKNQIDETIEESLLSKKKDISMKIEELLNRLDLPNKEYQKYLEEKSGWAKKEESLIGNATTVNTLEYYKAQLDELTKVPEQLKLARQSQMELAGQIFLEKLKMLKIYEELYRPVQEFINAHPLAKNRFGLQFNVSLVPINFPTRFLEFINQGRKGSFYGETEGRERIENIISKANFNSNGELDDFLNDVINHLYYNLREDKTKANSITSQLKQAHSPGELYDYLFSLDYLVPRYLLLWEDKPLEQLSPGERGTLLLVFYLLIDDSKIPLVMDQPEGNLDNQTVYQLLVDCIKEAKSKRQIFVVTHNPNIAVVCDAEQIIYAFLNKKQDYQLEYVSGALENPEICLKIVDILEGTRPAIDNRVAKYKIIFENNVV
ncbi:MAG: TrlF family AAA-like ATPase [Candidatus Humimicrobiaceae bacterium]